MKYEEQKFDIPALDGISERTITEHLKLYAGYVKHTNLIAEHIEELLKDAEKYAYELGELQRRLGFEFCGMRNHEHYFGSFEGGAKELPVGALRTAVEKEWGSFDTFLVRMKAIALMRGIGWAMLYHDPQADKLLMAWVGDHELGQLADCHIILAHDMWEHAYLLDYPPSEKKKYIDSYFANVNWNKISEIYESVSHK